MPIVNTPPPAKTASAPRTSAKKTATLAARTEAVSTLGQFAQVPLIALKQYADVGAINLHWPRVSEEIAKLAEAHEEIARIIDPLMQVGPYAGLITAVLPMVMQIAVNHGRMAPGAMGTVPSSALSAQIETALAQQELEALRVQREAEAQAHAMRAEIENERKAAMANAPRGTDG
jgi:hypothetical protein